MAPQSISYQQWQAQYRHLFMDRIQGRVDLESLEFGPVHWEYLTIDSEDTIQPSSDDKQVIDRFVRLNRQIFLLAEQGKLEGENPVIDAERGWIYYLVGFANRVLAVNIDGKIGINLYAHTHPNTNVEPSYGEGITAAEVDMIYFLFPFVERILVRAGIQPAS